MHEAIRDIGRIATDGMTVFGTQVLFTSGNWDALHVSMMYIAGTRALQLPVDFVAYLSSPGSRTSCERRLFNAEF